MGGTANPENEDKYSLKDAVSQQFLSEDQDGSLSFADDDMQGGAQWYLRPYEEDVEEVLTETTYFWLENVQSGNKLRRRSLQKKEARERFDTFDLGTKASVAEDDLFVFRGMEAKNVKKFLHQSLVLGLIKRFHAEVTAAAGGNAAGIDSIHKEYLLPDP